MQIGTNRNLPGCSSPSGGGALPPPLPAAMVARTPRQGRKRKIGLGLGIFLFLLVAAVACGILFYERAAESPAVRSIRGAVVPWISQVASGRFVLPFAGGTNAIGSLSVAQRRMATDFSPIRPIHEAKRVQALAGARAAVASLPADAGTNRPVATGNATGAALSVVSPEASVAATNAPPQVPRATRTINPAPVTLPAWPQVRVTALLGSERGRVVARINGSLVTLGDTVDGMKVAALSPESVTLEMWGQKRTFTVTGSGL